MIKITVIATVIALLAVSFVIIITPHAFAMSAYNKGQIDATRDYHGLNGHGYDDSCPSGHSYQYCANYKNAYATQWTQTNNDDLIRLGIHDDADTQTQTGAIGGNDVKTTGDNSPVTINQLLSQKTENNSPDSTANGENADHNGGTDMSHCKAFCVN